MAKITAPVEGYKGRIGDVIFRDGVAETDDIAVIAYCRGAGYKVEGYEQVPTQLEQQQEPVDPRDVDVERVGTPLRDAAVDPRPEDFLPPINAGKPGPEGNPHSGNVVAPGIHAVTGPGPIVPGPVLDDPAGQQARETEAAARVLAGAELVPEVTADMAEQAKVAEGPAEQVEPPAGNASTEEWRAYAVDHRGAAPEQVAGMKRDDLREQYGPQPE
jgi:hypothetical protein